nr:MAG TPA: hypothetical protein [Caudoviricetes sp.]DAM53947.1 MAG TPA: hypothetical protein [Caudoviricetes sp.]
MIGSDRLSVCPFFIIIHQLWKYVNCFLLRL